MFASLDDLSLGSAGWNTVTTVVGAVVANYNRPEHMERDIRYERARVHRDCRRAAGLVGGSIDRLLSK